jgi:Peptidase family M50.
MKGKKLNPRSARALSFTLAIVEFIFLYLIYESGTVGILYRVIIALLSLAFVGGAIRRALGTEGSYGIYLLGSKRGIKTINSISKRHKWFWKGMADWGIILGFGLLSYLIIKKRRSWLYLLGILTIVFSVLFVIPYTAYGLQFIKVSSIQAIGYSNSASPLSNLTISALPYLALIIGITVVLGFTGYLFYALGISALGVLELLAIVISKALSGAPTLAPLSNEVPGILPVIPGITIPLISGIIAFVIIIVIHEASHGILAAMVKTKINKVGLLVFGVIPVGAFVEPDEAKVLKLDREAQNRIYSAGVAANFIAMFVFFVLLLSVLPYVNNNIMRMFVTSVVPGYPANGIIATGSEITSWNGQIVTDTASLASASANDLPGKAVHIVTNKGSYSLIAQKANGTSRGIIGVDLAEAPVLGSTPNKIVYFLYGVFAITMMLNFLIGVINLLPLPMLDGWRIYKNSIRKRTWIIKVLAAFVVFTLVIVALPWLGGLQV